MPAQQFNNGIPIVTVLFGTIGGYGSSELHVVRYTNTLI
jgi:hypothetical protein